MTPAVMYPKTYLLAKQAYRSVQATLILYLKQIFLIKTFVSINKLNYI